MVVARDDGRRARIEAKLRHAFAPEHLEVIDESAQHAGHAGARDGRGHFRAIIVSARFDGLSPVAAQRLVYSELADEMQRDIHALAMKLYTPERWRTLS